MSVISILQTFFGISKSELSVVAVLLLGITIGLFVKYFSGEDEGLNNKAQVFHALDSLADVQKSTYTGTDVYNNTYPELAQADTSVKKKGFNRKKAVVGKININTASKIELIKLPGIGEKTAIKILEYRKSTPFLTPENIINIKGIGPKKYEKMKQYIEVK